MNNAKRLSISIVTLVILCVFLCVSSFALGVVVHEVSDNSFRTGVIKIDLNNGEPIINANEFIFEPGMRVKKSFYIENQGTWDVYYKLYFANASGDLAEALEVTVTDEKGRVLLDGKVSELNETNAFALEDELSVNERKTLFAEFYFPENSGNDYQDTAITFRLAAIAVQTKNNPMKEFD